MPSAVERDAARRAEIIAAAKTCFLRFGYGKTSLDDIAREAGLSRPLLYRKYPNKEAIFSAVYDAVFLAQFAKAAAIVALPGGRRARLVQMCEVVCVEPYEEIMQAPMAEEFLIACEQVIPEVLDDHARRWRALLGKVLPARLVEVFDLAIEGMLSDTPSVAGYRKRIAVLAERFTER
jgi:TetR/AcrR family transcriptional regulator, transcriptional repressor of aconitase